MKTLNELAEYVSGQVRGDGSVQINQASTLGHAKAGEISFLANKKYEKLLFTTKSSAVIAGKDVSECSVPLLVCDDPYYAFTQIMILLHGHRKHKNIGISSKASVSDSASVGTDCHIHDFVTISDNSKIGNGCIIYPGVFIAEDVHIGNDCIIYPNAVIYDGSRIGNRVIINSNSAIGEDGFGFATHNGIHHKIPQIGIAVLEDDVEIGACCAIERGTLGNTVIGHGTKIGDLVAIGHGTKLGHDCLLVPQVAIAGSTTIGHHCVAGGQVGIVGHITIGNMVSIGAQSGVINDIPDGKSVLGAPAIDSSQAKRAYSLIGSLPEMRKTLRSMEKRISQIEDSKST